MQLTPRLFERSSDAITRAVDRAEQVLDQGLKGRGRLLDIAAIKDGASGRKKDARLWVYELLLESAELARGNAFDHLRALPADLARDPRPALSHFTLVRAAMEAGGMFGYLTERDVDVHELLARIAGLRIADVDSALRFAESHSGSPGLVAEVRKTEGELLDLFAAGGITHRRDRRGKLLETEVGGHTADGDMKIAKAARAFLDHDGHDPYNLVSGSAHSRPWVLGPAKDSSPGGAVLYLLWFTDALLTAWLNRWSAFTGVEPDPSIAKVTQSIRFTIARAAAGEFHAV
ncbi:hypothetical protein ACWGCK_09475 [Streptomyces virginiae]